MTNKQTELISLIEGKAQSILDNAGDYFIAKIHCSSTRHITILYDAEHSPVSMGWLSQANKKLRQELELLDEFKDGNFSLEVSSYGVDEPLLFLKQYHKNKGRTLKVSTKDKQEYVGELKHVDTDNIILTLKAKKTTSEMTIPMSHIDKAIVQIIF